MFKLLNKLIASILDKQRQNPQEKIDTQFLAKWDEQGIVLIDPSAKHIRTSFKTGFLYMAELAERPLSSITAHDTMRAAEMINELETTLENAVLSYSATYKNIESRQEGAETRLSETLIVSVMNNMLASLDEALGQEFYNV